jgi:DNA-binding transcriptional ArsR family regulator
MVSFNHMVERSAVLDSAYGALAHEVRRAMLEHLREGELRVTDLAAPFDMSLAAASKHVRVLEDAGLVRRTVLGREHHLALEAAPLRPAAEWLGTYTTFWEDRLDALERHLRKRGRA